MNTILGDIYFYPFGCIRESLSIFFSPVLDSCNQVTIARHVMGGFAGVLLSHPFTRHSQALHNVEVGMHKDEEKRNRQKH